MGMFYENKRFLTTGKFIPEDSSGTQREYFHTLYANGVMALGNRLQALVSLPRHNFFHTTGGRTLHTGGIGDMQLGLQGRWINNNDSSACGWRHQFVFGGNVKLPTGKVQALDSDPDMHLNMRTGSGSVDFIFAGGYWLTKEKGGLSLQTSVRLNGNNASHERNGHSVKIAAHAFYGVKLLKERLRVVTRIGPDYEYQGANRMENVPDQYSGGAIIRMDAGLDTYVGNWVIRGAVGLPGDQFLGKGLLKAQTQYTLGLLFNIPRNKNKNKT